MEPVARPSHHFQELFVAASSPPDNKPGGLFALKSMTVLHGRHHSPVRNPARS
jgi:hypothetical protein